MVIPCGIKASMSEEDKAAVLQSCEAFVAQMRAAGVRCRGDMRDNSSPGWKFNHWELKVSVCVCVCVVCVCVVCVCICVYAC